MSIFESMWSDEEDSLLLSCQCGLYFALACMGSFVLLGLIAFFLYVFAGGVVWMSDVLVGHFKESLPLFNAHAAGFFMVLLPAMFFIRFLQPAIKRKFG